MAEGVGTDVPEQLEPRQAHGGVARLDLAGLLSDLEDPAVVASGRADYEETRDPHPAVVGRTGPGPNPGAAKADGDRLRYAFPTLILRGRAGEQVLSGWNDAEALEDQAEAKAQAADEVDGGDDLTDDVVTNDNDAKEAN